MKITSCDYKTGYHGVTIGLKQAEIEEVIALLNHLKESKCPAFHFHFHSLFKEESGVADIEFHKVPDETASNAGIG